MKHKDIYEILSEERRKKDEPKLIHYAIGFPIGMLLSGLIAWWENHVIHYKVLGYWQWVALSLAMFLAGKLSPKVIPPILGLVCAVCLVAQAASWIGLLALPIIKP